MKEKCKKLQKKKKNKQRQKVARGTEAILKEWELSGFVMHVRFSPVNIAFSKAFSKAVSKASLIFKSNLELALSIILKQRELYESKHAAVSVNV